MTSASRPLRARTLRLPLGLGGGAPATVISAIASVLFVACAVEVALGPWPAWLRAPCALALVFLASLSSRLLPRARPPAQGWLIVDERGVHRTAPGAEDAVLLDWSEPFGVSVHGSADRGAFLIALTTRRAARFVSARVTGAADAAAAPTLFARATTAADSDLRVDEGAMLSASSAEMLLGAIARRAPQALERLYLSDAGGEAIVLEHGELLVGGRRIDLAAPLEWRASIFQERGAHAASVCQATWVRQGEAEVVLVAPLPGDGSWVRQGDPFVRAAGEERNVQRSVARDLRLMQATVGEPPPRELRRAIDHLFMLPLRHALDRAPRLDHARGQRRRSPRSSHP